MLRRMIRRTLPFVIIVSLLGCGEAAASENAPADFGQIFTAEETEYIKSCGTLKVGFVQDRIPVSFTDENGELGGVSRYIFDRIQEISGLKFEYAPLPAGAVTYDYLLGEGYDLVTSVEFNEQNKKARGIQMSDPYFSSRKVIVASRDLDFSYGDPLSVALSSGSQTIKKVLADTYPNFEILDYDSISACFDAVSRGEADVMILNQYVAEYWLFKPAYEGLKVIPALGLEDQLCFSAVVPFDETGQPVGTEGDTLISILDKAIAYLTEDEVDGYTIQAVMRNQYEFTVSDFLQRYRYAVAILITSAILIIFLLSMLLRQRLRSVEDRANARAKEQFLSAMNHEIRTPLNGMIGLNYLMTQKLEDSGQMKKYLQQSTATAEYLLSLVNDILDMSMLQDLEMTLEQKPVDLNLLFSTVMTIIGGGAAEKKQKFAADIDLPHPGILGDGVRIQQVLLNLLDNARKFTPEGGVIRLTVRQSVTKKGLILTRAEVSDTGQGISEEFQKQIFDTFAQERTTVSKGNQGTGLGLPISSHLAKLMHGELAFVRHKGEGSTFTFSFPAQEAELPKEEPKPGLPAAERPEKSRVLVAEDNELNGAIMLELLSAAGFEAVLAENGKAALDLFRASAPGEYSIILMDLLMPEMDGFAATAAIRALDREDAKTVRIYACSANCAKEDRERAKRSGMDDFLAKPIDVQELLKKLNG